MSLKIKLLLYILFPLFFIACKNSQPAIEEMFLSSKKTKRGLFKKKNQFFNQKDHIKKINQLNKKVAKAVNDKKTLEKKQKLSAKELRIANRKIKRKNNFDKKISKKKFKGGE